MPDEINELIAAIRAGALEQIRLVSRLQAALKSAPTSPRKPGRPPGPATLKPQTQHRLGTLEPEGYRPPPDTISKVLADEAPASPVYVSRDKRALQDMLAEAARNTAKLPRDDA